MKSLFLLTSMWAGVSYVAYAETNPSYQNKVPVQDKRDTVVMIVMGGWNSCNGEKNPRYTGMADKAASVLSEVRAKTGRGWRSVLSCFDKRGRLYYGSFYPKKIYQTKISTIKRFVNYIENHISDLKKMTLIMVGHSHGGWLAMKLLSYLKPSIEIRKLVLIDPISYYHCQPSHYAKIFSRGPKIISGCLKFPPDFGESGRRDMLSRLGNQRIPGVIRLYYQKNFKFLHSSEFPRTRGFKFPHSSSDKSAFLKYWADGAAAAFNAHTRIDTLGSIWYPIEDSLIREK